jgi:hypothetical protein
MSTSGLLLVLFGLAAAGAALVVIEATRTKSAPWLRGEDGARSDIHHREATPRRH